MSTGRKNRRKNYKVGLASPIHDDKRNRPRESENLCEHVSRAFGLTEVPGEVTDSGQRHQQ